MRYQVKQFSVLCMGWCKPLDSLNLFLSYAPQRSEANPISLFTLRSDRRLLLAFCQLLSNHHWGWQHPLDGSFRSPHLHLVARNLWWLWHFLLIDMAGDIFISHPQSLKDLWIFPSILTHGHSKQQWCTRSSSHFESLIFFLNQSGKTSVKRILWLNQATWIILYLKIQWFVSLITSAKAHCSGM